MGAPPLTTHKPIWMHRRDEADLVKLKNLLGLRDGTTVTIPDAIGEALRLAVAQMEGGHAERT